MKVGPSSPLFCSFRICSAPLLDLDFVVLKKIFLPLVVLSVVSTIYVHPALALSGRDFDPERPERIRRYLQKMYDSTSSDRKAKILVATLRWNALSYQDKQQTIRRLKLPRKAQQNMES